jgi:hypothetical protein
MQTATLSDMGRIRVYFDADETLRLAIRTAALRAGRSGSAIIEEILKASLGDAMKEAEQILADRPKSASAKKAKKPHS